MKVLKTSIFIPRENEEGGIRSVHSIAYKGHPALHFRESCKQFKRIFFFRLQMWQVTENRSVKSRRPCNLFGQIFLQRPRVPLLFFSTLPLKSLYQDSLLLSFFLKYLRKPFHISLDGYFFPSWEGNLAFPLAALFTRPRIFRPPTKRSFSGLRERERVL